MDDFTRIAPLERRRIFSETAIRKGVAFAIIEKDFWVCWVLKMLFSLSPKHPPLVFKGGTSLAKAYGLIDRFSEDIDIVTVVDFYLSRGLNDPEKATSKSKRSAQMEALDVACADYVIEGLRGELQQIFQERLGATEDWELNPDPHDPYQHSLLFRYPLSGVDSTHPYIRNSVKIELGWRSADEPVEMRVIRPYIADQYSELRLNLDIRCTVLAPVRTFWEKVTALHAESFRERTPQFFSRHYSDVAAMSETVLGKMAARNLEMLDDVRRFKERYYASAWARYYLAIPGSLVIVPNARKITELASDYREMRPLFFSEPPPFERVIEQLRALQQEINRKN